MSKKIITHSRMFNLDEIAAIALLDRFLTKDYEIIRTRDEKLLNQFKEDNSAFVIDVGFEYDDKKLNFDHHQNKMTLVWDNGVPYSSCGLIWKWLKDQKLLTEFSNNELMKIESNFIRKVDALDNGVKQFPEMNFVFQSNRNHHDDKVIDRHFDRTLSLVKNYLNTLIDNISNNLKDVNKSNAKFNTFFEMVTTAALIKNYGAMDRPKMKINDKIMEFSDNEGNHLMTFDFDKRTFKEDNKTQNVNEDFVSFSWNKIKQNKKVISQKMNDETILGLEKNLINLFKINDNVPKNLTYISMYEDSNLPAKEGYDAMNGFIHNVFAEIRNELKNNKEVVKFINQSKNMKGVVFCNRNIKSAAHKIAELCPDKTLIIMPRDKKSWKIMKLPNKQNKFFMPSEWCGKNKDSLKKLGQNQLIFCHKAGFMCMFEGSKEEAIKFSEDLVAKHKLENKNVNKVKKIQIINKKRKF